MVEYEASYSSTVPLAEHEKIMKELEQERKLTAKLQDEIEGYTNRYEYASFFSFIFKVILGLFICK